MEAFGFEKKVEVGGFKKFKGEKNQKYVGAFAITDPAKLFIGSDTHYHQGSQKRWICLSDKKTGTQEICCTYDYAGNEPTFRMGTVFVLYKVDDSGVIKGIADVLPWVFSAKLYNNLKGIYTNHGLVDLDLTCTDGKFQNFIIIPRKGCVWAENAQTKAYVDAACEKQSKNLVKQIATKMAVAEIREHLGIGGGADDASSGMDFSSISSSMD